MHISYQLVECTHLTQACVHTSVQQLWRQLTYHTCSSGEVMYKHMDKMLLVAKNMSTICNHILYQKYNVFIGSSGSKMSQKYQFWKKYSTYLNLYICMIVVRLCITTWIKCCWWLKICQLFATIYYINSIIYLGSSGSKSSQ